MQPESSSARSFYARHGEPTTLELHPTRTFYSRPGDHGLDSDSPESHSARAFYGRSRDPESTEHWQPGQTFTPSVSLATDALREMKSSFHSMISTMQAGISAEIERMQEAMADLSKCVENVESQLTASSTVTGSGSEVETPGSKRNRRSSVELQVRFCVLYIIMIITL